MKVIAKIEKGGGQIRVCLDKWKSELYCDLRFWYVKDTDYHPTPKGIRFNVELLPELRAALEEAERLIEAGEDLGDSRQAGESQG
ncbi:MAG: transcriptional coactivator p15/PC4 family protein [Candidatus Aminicenantales bacterium]